MAERLPNTSIQQTNPSVVSLEKGKIPPQAIDLEAVVLGAITSIFFIRNILGNFFTRQDTNFK